MRSKLVPGAWYRASALSSLQTTVRRPLGRVVRRVDFVTCKNCQSGRRLQVVFITPEVAPWSKVGGLGDVMSALPAALAARGHRVMTVAPRYQQYAGVADTGVVAPIELHPAAAPLLRYPRGRRSALTKRVAAGMHYVRYYATCERGVDRVFVEHPLYSGTEAYAQGPWSYCDDTGDGLDVRCSVLSQAALAAPALLWGNGWDGGGTEGGEAVVGPVEARVCEDWREGVQVADSGNDGSVHDESELSRRGEVEHESMEGTVAVLEAAAVALRPAVMSAGIEAAMIASTSGRHDLNDGGTTAQRRRQRHTLTQSVGDSCAAWVGEAEAALVSATARASTGHTFAVPAGGGKVSQVTDRCASLQGGVHSSASDSVGVDGSDGGGSIELLPLVFVANDWATAPALLRLVHLYRDSQHVEAVERAWLRRLRLWLAHERRRNGQHGQGQAQAVAGGEGSMTLMGLPALHVAAARGGNAPGTAPLLDPAADPCEVVPARTSGTTAAAAASANHDDVHGPVCEAAVGVATLAVGDYFHDVLELRQLLRARLEGARSTFCIHNLAFQGVYPKAAFRRLCLPLAARRSLALCCMPTSTVAGGVPITRQQCVQADAHNWVKAAIRECDLLVTVSPRYAEEVATDEGLSCGLAAHIADKGIIGIMNGIDAEEWDPSTDVLLPPVARYGLGDAHRGKAIAKVLLQGQLGLDRNPRAPLFAFVGRLTEQKGVDVLMAAVPQFLATPAAPLRPSALALARGGVDAGVEQLATQQLVILGTGGMWEENAARTLAERFPRQAAAVLRFDEAVAHLLYAAADYLVVPSRYEPCGLVALCGARYGTLPLVAATGGLRDLAEGQGLGYYFEPIGQPGDVVAFRSAVQRLQAALLRAAGEFGSPQHRAMCKACMSHDVSWRQPARLWEEALLKLFSIDSL